MYNRINTTLGGILLLFLLFSLSISAQSYTIESCQEKAKANYPLVKQYDLIEQTAQYNISNANKGYLPQLSLSARGTYQSDVTSLPIKIPGMSIPALTKDQYQASIEATQVLWDGGVISAQKKITNASTEIEKKKLEVDLFALNERVNQLFFGILLLKEQIAQTAILQSELNTNLGKVKSLVQNGVANQADIDAIQVEIINVSQRETELKSTSKAYLIMLSAMTAVEITDATQLTKPKTDLAIATDTTNNRPELSLFEAQNKLYESQKSLLNAGNLPKLLLFAQGGYGKPALNMLSNEFSTFYIGGVRLAWNFSGLYTQKNNIEKLEVSKKTVDIQKETFLFNTNLRTKQQQTEIEKIKSLISNDDEIIRLRENIKKAATAKVENGTLTVTDLIREINAENQAKQVKALHETQLTMTVYQLKNNINQ